MERKKDIVPRDVKRKPREFRRHKNDARGSQKVKIEPLLGGSSSEAPSAEELEYICTKREGVVEVGKG